MIDDEPSGDGGEEAISLDALSAAYAEAMAREGAGAADAVVLADREAAEAAVEEPPDEADRGPADEDPGQVSPQSILEAMLFVGNAGGEPLEPGRAAELMRGVSPGEIPEMVAALNRRYAAHGCPYHVESQGSGYRMTLRSEFHPVRNKLYGRIREAWLSQAAVDVLAIVAYRQPITAEEVSRLRQTPSGHILALLVQRQLLSVERVNQPRRKSQYRTTQRFLNLFGMEGLGDLPQSDDLDGK
jgi:segregation and condensation protein B